MSRRLVLKYDIFEDIKSDPNVKHGMIVETLGFDSVGDGFSATYKVLSTSIDNSFNSDNGDVRIRTGLYARPIKLAEVDDILSTIQGKITEINDILDDFNADVEIINQLSERIHAIETVINDYATKEDLNSAVTDINNSLDAMSTKIDNDRYEVINYVNDTYSEAIENIGNNLKANEAVNEIDLTGECGVKIIRHYNGLKSIVISSKYNTEESEGW